MAVPTNSGEWDMPTEDFNSDLSSLLVSPRWSPLRLTPLLPPHFLPSSSSMVVYQGPNQYSMDNSLQNQQQHDDNIVDPALNMGFEESEEMMMRCFSFPPSPTYFPLCPPVPYVFFVSNPRDISLALSYQHILEDKSGSLHVIEKMVEHKDICELLVDRFNSYLYNYFNDVSVIARELEVGMVPKDMVSLVVYIWKKEYNYEKEMMLRRINWLEQHDEDIVDQPVFEEVGVVQQLIQNRGGELDVILGGGAFTINGMEGKYVQGLPTTPDTLLICQAKYSFRVWLGHGGQWVAECRFRCNRLNIGSFTTVEDAISGYEVVWRRSGWVDPSDYPGLFGNENKSKLSLQSPPLAQEKRPGEDFGLVGCNAAGNDEIKAVGTASGGTRDFLMADQAPVIISRCVGKRKTKEKNPRGGERTNKKSNGVRIAIPLEDILQTKGMRRKEAVKHLGVSQSAFKYACREYGISRWSPHNLISQSYPDETPALVDEEGIQQSNSDTLSSDQALVASVEKTIDVEVEAAGTGQSEMGEGQLNSRYLGKEKRKDTTPRGESRNEKTSGVRIAISLEDILRTKEIPLKDAAKHLEVSRSTLKRACRKYNISSWPPRGEHTFTSQSRSNESPVVVDKEQIPQLNSNTLLPSNQVSATTDAKSVIVKASYGTVKIRFQLSWPWEMVELQQEVKKRLELEAGTYYIQYKDEDNDDILVACDEDLRDPISRSSLLGTNSIGVFLRPK